MLKRRRAGIFCGISMMLAMSVSFGGCGKQEENVVVQQDYAYVEQEAEFDMLIADAYMNALVAKLDESYGYRNDYEIVSMTQDGNTVILYYDWYRASDQYSESCVEVQLIYQGINGVWGEPQKTFGEVKSVWKLEGEWGCKYENIDIYFKVNRCDGDRIFVEYEFKNFPVYDKEEGEYFVRDLSTDGEVEMVCSTDGTEDRWKRTGVENEFNLVLDKFREFEITSYIKHFPLTKIE